MVSLVYHKGYNRMEFTEQAILNYIIGAFIVAKCAQRAIIVNLD